MQWLDLQMQVEPESNILKGLCGEHILYLDIQGTLPNYLHFGAKGSVR